MYTGIPRNKACREGALFGYTSLLRDYAKDAMDAISVARATIFPGFITQDPSVHNQAGYFADECVVALNKRGKEMMRRLGVPIVPSYEITLNQPWATPKADGR